MTELEWFQKYTDKNPAKMHPYELTLAVVGAIIHSKIELPPQPEGTTVKMLADKILEQTDEARTI